jgi:glycosyltransferase involved in cell wall biosynthesis
MTAVGRCTRPNGSILHTQRRTQSVARNTGAAIATGRYLHFLDGDDWMLPGAFAKLWQLAQQQDGADWLYGGTQLVDRNGDQLIQLRHGFDGNVFTQVMAGEWIPLLASLIRTTAFFGVGGFNPLLPVSEDIDLCRRISLRGDVAETTALVACYSIGIEGSSSPRTRDAECSRWSRERVLGEPHAWSRMLASASNNYWRGRVSRAYLTSAIWNLQHGKMLTAMSRITFGLASLIMAGRHVFSLGFLQALGKPHESFAFAKGHRDLARSM